MSITWISEDGGQVGAVEADNILIEQTFARQGALLLQARRDETLTKTRSGGGRA